jgi:hypothetical protein
MNAIPATTASSRTTTTTTTNIRTDNSHLAMQLYQLHSNFKPQIANQHPKSSSQGFQTNYANMKRELLLDQ